MTSVNLDALVAITTQIHWLQKKKRVWDRPMVYEIDH